MTAHRTGRTVVIGIGNEFARDDAIGPTVARNVAAVDPAGVEVLVLDGEPARLVEAWAGADHAVVVDAAHLDGGHDVVVLDGVGAEINDRERASSHGAGVGTAIGMARALGRLPPRLTVVAVRGVDFAPGIGITPTARAAIDRAGGELLRLLRPPAR